MTVIYNKTIAEYAETYKINLQIQQDGKTFTFSANEESGDYEFYVTLHIYLNNIEQTTLLLTSSGPTKIITLDNGIMTIKDISFSLESENGEQGSYAGSVSDISLEITCLNVMIGNIRAEKVYIGNSEVKHLYLGTAKIF